MLNRNRIIQNINHYRGFNANNNYPYQGDKHYLYTSLKGWNITNNQNFSVYIRLKMNKRIGEYDTYVRLFTIFDNVNSNGIFLQLARSLNFTLRNRGVSNSITSGLNVTTTRPHSLFFVIDSNYIKGFVDGEIFNRVSRTVAIANSLENHNLYIYTEKEINNTNFVNVIIEEIAIFQKALSEIEVMKIYKNEKLYNDKKCLLWSVFDNRYIDYDVDYGNIRFRDLSGKGNNLMFGYDSITGNALRRVPFNFLIDGVETLEFVMGEVNYRSEGYQISVRNRESGLYYVIDKQNLVRKLEAIR